MTTPAPALDSKAVAEAIDITPKELRVYLRAIAYEKVEGRYAFSKADVAKLKKGYTAWVKGRAAARAAKAAANEADSAEPPVSEAS